MEIKITSNLKSYESKWSEFNIKHPQGNVFQSPEFFKVYQGTINYEPTVWFALDDKDDLCGLLVANKIKQFNKPMEGLSSRSIITGGPLVLDYLHLSKLLNCYSEENGNKVIFTQVRNLFDKSGEHDIFINGGYEYEPHLNYLIGLDEIESAWTNLNKKRRTSIRSAQKKGVTVHELKDGSEIGTFYDLIKATYKRVKVPLADVSLFKSAYKHLDQEKMVKYFFAMHEEKYIGALALLNYKDRAYMWYLGSLGEYLKYN
ncbi:MAG: peptidoglycan bridge formation glycyltransferase FemA/FemB family protein, partial [Euryarchaeota archaeon]|nr:peptidoglycan bridge formation glycyltransferase FemA/FemB family protein [Euryarchaeota archaeon]